MPQTAPAKALGATHSLKDLAHSITGGALAAQGYWLPYHCARSLCITFCYPIRWALTPVFGVDFVEDCLTPQNAWYGKFKISSEVVRHAERETEGWRHLAGSRDGSPSGGIGGTIVDLHDVPRSIPRTDAASTARELRPRPIFSSRSPFDIDVNAANRHYTHAASGPQSPGLSPKSSPAVSLSGWTSINSPATKTPASAGNLSRSLLTQPREASGFVAGPVKTERHSHKRRQSAGDESQRSYTGLYATNSQGQASPPVKMRKRRRGRHPRSGRVANSQSEDEVVYTSEDERAALMLLRLNKDDAQLAHR